MVLPALTGPGPTRTYCRLTGSLRPLAGSSDPSETVQCLRDDRQMSFGGSGLSLRRSKPPVCGVVALVGAVPLSHALVTITFKGRMTRVDIDRWCTTPESPSEGE